MLRSIQQLHHTLRKENDQLIQLRKVKENSQSYYSSLTRLTLKYTHGEK